MTVGSRATVTACIITRDEERALPGCLASVAFCDEVVVVDSGSRDATAQIARAAGAKVVDQPWLGFSAQRNVAIDHAAGEWVLEIDADERITPPLRAEIEAFLDAPAPGVEIAGLPLRDVFLGHRLGPSAKYPKFRHRFFRRGAYRHDERRTVHERLIPEGAVHPFAGDLEHLLAESWGQALGDTWSYARLESGQITAPRTPAAVVKGALLRPAAKLGYRLAVDGGWRDGPAGLARILLDCATDTIVWARHALGRRGPVTGESGVPAGQHYGSWRLRVGPPRVVAVALGATAFERALSRLAAARESGADVTLVSDVTAPAGADGVRVHHLPNPRPLAVIRALEAEDQLRTMDDVMFLGRRARTLMRLTPRHLRGTGELAAGPQAPTPPA